MRQKDLKLKKKDLTLKETRFNIEKEHLQVVKDQLQVETIIKEKLTKVIDSESSSQILHQSPHVQQANTYSYTDSYADNCISGYPQYSDL